MISTKIKIIDDIALKNNVDNDESINNTVKKRGRKKKIINTENIIQIQEEILQKKSSVKINNIKSNDLIKELLTKQIPIIHPSKKLNYNDIKRISKFLSSSIFNMDECSIWTGYVTNEKNQAKGIYINFYFNHKKIALHRLLYLNYIGDILNTEYIKFSCVNKGKCCNIHHMKKYIYNSNPQLNNNDEKTSDNYIHIVQNKEELVVEL